MEGPSLVILKEEIQQFKGKKILKAEGYAKIELDAIRNKVVKDIKTWGKYLFICLPQLTVRIHFGLFGNYRINDHKKGRNASLGLHFRNGVFNCYIASVKIIKEPLEALYDWRLDSLSPKWSMRTIKKLVLAEDGKQQIGDVLLKPSLFPSVGNIIRNEVLYRSKAHPESLLQALPDSILTQIIKETKQYSKDFLAWKKKDELSAHWEIYTQKKCPKDHAVKKKYTGKTKRRSFICPCLEKYK